MKLSHHWISGIIHLVMVYYYFKNGEFDLLIFKNYWAVILVYIHDTFDECLYQTIGIIRKNINILNFNSPISIYGRHLEE